MVKGHMQDGKFHPHTDYKKGTRKSRDQNSKQDGVKIRKDRDVSVVGFSQGAVREMGGKLISYHEKEFLRRRVADIFGNAIIAPVNIFNDDRDKKQESHIQFESEVTALTAEMVRKVGDKKTYGLRIVKVGRPFKNPAGKIRIDTQIVKFWADEILKKGEIT